MGNGGGCRNLAFRLVARVFRRGYPYRWSHLSVCMMDSMLLFALQLLACYLKGLKNAYLSLLFEDAQAPNRRLWAMKRGGGQEQHTIEPHFASSDFDRRR